MASSNVAITQFGAAAAITYAIQFLKKSRWFPLIKEGQVIGTRVWSLLAATLTQVGINYSWNANANGTHNLIIENISLAAVMYAIWHVFCSYALQETIYQAAINKPVAPSLAQQDVMKEEQAQVVAVTPKQADGR
jgi:hypothetical protein